MANSKISALTSATTPLAGTETLPIVQSGTTKQVSVANLTVGRTVTMGGALVTTTGSTIANITGGGSNGSSWYFNTGANTLLAVGDAATITGGAANTTAQIYTGNAIPLSIAVSGAERWSFDASFNLTPKTAAKGINFTANTPAAGMTSQLLNWYEEGTWTPVASAATGSITSYSSGGTYTRVGRQVTVTAYVNLTNVGTAAGSMLINNFPYKNGGSSGAGYLQQMGVVRETGVTGIIYSVLLAGNSTSGYITSLTGGAITWISSYQYALSITYYTA